MCKSTCARLILASSSPRRKELLAGAGWKFETIAPPIDEPFEELSKLSAARQAESLAYFKARAVWESNPDACVLGADTVVAVGERVLGKAADASAAGAMLASLAGTRHAVITGVAALGLGGARIIASQTSYVTMRQLTAGQIAQYVASGEWRGKAGAYAIQETGDRFVESLAGSFTNVVGLPMELVGRMVEEISAHPDAHKR